jgi:hypothetical protein
MMVGLTREQRLERAINQTEQASAVIDRDPEEALDRLEPVVKAAPNVGEITPQDMFNLFKQLQAQQVRMQEQMLLLMTGQNSGAPNPNARHEDMQKELNQDRVQREATLEAWRSEPREPVWVQPDDDEAKIHTVTNMYPPRIFRVNGLEFPITPGEIVEVPSSIAALVRYTQRQRPLQAPPQGLPQFPDPQRGQFLAAAQSVTVGQAGRSGEGRLIPEGLPPAQPLGIRYDHNGQ